MKEEIRTLKIRQKTLEETNNTLNQILENFKLDLKVRIDIIFCFWWASLMRTIQNALDEKVLLVEKINGVLEHEARLEQENKRLREEQQRFVLIFCFGFHPHTDTKPKVEE